MPKLVEKNLTDNAVRTAQPREQRYDIYDAKIRGLGVRVSPAGGKTWFVMRRVDGRMRRKSVGRYPEISLADARIAGTAVLAKMAKGEIEGRQHKRRFGGVFEEWLRRDQGKNRTANQAESALRLHALPKLASRDLATIRKADILSITDKIVDAGTGVQANRVLAYLRRLFNWCIERDYIDHNPTAGIAKPHKEVSRDRTLTPDELCRVLRATDGLGYPFGPLLKLLIFTGQRRDEVAGMRWSEINLDDGTWTLPASRAKNGRAHVVHLAEPVLAILDALPRVDERDLVFTTNGERPVSGFSVAKRRIDEASGVTDWTLHDLRRSFATYTTEKLGVSPVVVDRILNHQSGAVRGVAAVYQRGQYLEERWAAMTAWADWLQSLNAGFET